MALKAQFKTPDIAKYLEQETEHYRTQVIRVLMRAGEKAIKKARDGRDYKDITANLRNSIGYIVTENGKVITGDFPNDAVGIKESRRIGKKTGNQLAYEIASDISGIALIIVAGMNYAVYLEAKNKDVLTSAEQWANSQIPILLKDIK